MSKWNARASQTQSIVIVGIPTLIRICGKTISRGKEGRQRLTTRYGNNTKNKCIHDCETVVKSQGSMMMMIVRMTVKRMMRMIMLAMTFMLMLMIKGHHVVHHRRDRDHQSSSSLHHITITIVNNSGRMLIIFYNNISIGSHESSRSRDNGLSPAGLVTTATFQALYVPQPLNPKHISYQPYHPPKK